MILSVTIIVFLMLESLNIAVLYLQPGFVWGHGAALISLLVAS